MASAAQIPERANTPANVQAVMQTGHLGPLLLQILEGPPHEQTILPRALVGEPSQLEWMGFYKSIGKRQALSHWRLELPDGQEIHMEEEPDHYRVHWDRVSLRRDPVGHGFRDAPGVILGIGLLALALFGKGGRS